MDKSLLEILISFISGLFAGSLLFLFYARLMAKKRNQTIKTEVDMILNRAKSQAGRIERSARQRAREHEDRSRSETEREIKSSKDRLRNQEFKLKQRESRLQEEFERRGSDLKKTEQSLIQEKELLEISEKKLQTAREQLEKQREELGQSLESAASMTKEQARDHLKASYEDEVKKELNSRFIQIEEEMAKKTEERSRLLLARAMARYAAEVTAERTVETLPIAGASTKGKIIGRDGRNIRALEAACGVDLIIGEGQETITISCFDPVRRAVAKKTLEKLMEEGRIHPALIEESVEKIRREIQSQIKEDGEKACFDLGIHDLNPSIIRVLGSLQYRFIEGQNLLKYSTEAAYIAALLASELGADEKIARRAGLLHAIGLAVPHTMGGSYAEVGAEFCRKRGEKPFICQAIRCHDGKIKPVSVLDHILQCASNLSRSRSGIKRSLLESHISRLKDLESLANSFDGVKRSFAIQAGSEIRVLADPSRILDERQMAMLCRDIAGKIRRELNLSGNVKVSVVREYRIVEHAR